MKQVNLFVVGAPKCGTTSLHKYLDQHQDICMSSYKEPHFFAGDLCAPQYIRSEKDYVDLFSDSQALVHGESSPMYLYSAEAPSRINEYNCESKILILIRNPIEMIVSLHNGLIANGKEDVSDLHEALKLEKERRSGRSIPKYCHPAESCFYLNNAQYSRHINRYIEVFGRERVKVVLMDEMQKDMAAVFDDILEFLGLNKSTDIDFSVQNESKAVRSFFIQRLFVLSSPKFRKVVKKLVPKKIISMVFNANLKPHQKSGVEQNVKRYLKDDLFREIDSLSLLLSKNLDHWKALYDD